MTADRVTIAERIHATRVAAEAADDAWSESLARAFGQRACHHRYDEDASRHPEECRRLRAAFGEAAIAHHLAWQASYDRTLAEPSNP